MGNAERRKNRRATLNHITSIPRKSAPAPHKHTDSHWKTYRSKQSLYTAAIIQISRDKGRLIIFTFATVYLLFMVPLKDTF
jgi:hypothetical protein